MRTLIIFLLLFTNVATNAYAEKVCWGINGQIKYFPTMAEVESFIASNPNLYHDRINSNRTGVPEQGGGDLYFDKLCYGVICGDAFCDRASESCTTCPQDCGTCTNPNPYCGDGVCDVDENCSTCERDCGVCPPPPPPSEWTFCADETQPPTQCSFTGKRKVRYGANGVYNFGEFDNGVLCANSVFGDPIVGTVKQCHYGVEIICVPDGSCNAPPPACDQISQGTDNCGNPCGVAGLPCLTFTTITAFEKWLTTTSIKGADTAPIEKGIRIGTSPNYKYYKVTITAVNGN